MRVDDAPLAVMKEHWGYGRFLPLQREAMGASCRAPAQWSCCPRAGTSPSCQVPAARLDRSLSEDERRAACTGTREGTLKLPYVSPEHLLMDRHRGDGWFSKARRRRA